MDMKNPSLDPHESSKKGQIRNGSISTRPGSSKRVVVKASKDRE